MNGLGLYVHIPFCARKCAYCDFPSYAVCMGWRDEYINKLTLEIVQMGEVLDHPVADTAYIGGGTPTLLTPKQMQRVLTALHTAFPMEEDCEFSCEANPGMVSDAMLETLASGGVNRLSIGAQSANAKELRLLGRQHTWQQVAQAVNRARHQGINNLNIDLMMGLPTQTIPSFSNTLDEALALHPDHISCYGLIVEEGTSFAQGVADGSLTLPAEEEESAMASLALERLEGAGLARYEVSNYAKPGKACRHNLNCWQRVPYLGFGSAAHSLMPNLSQRRANPESLRGYLNGDPYVTTELTPEDQRFESVMLGLRMVEGLSLDRFRAMHGVDFLDVYRQPAERAVAQGVALHDQHTFRLTKRGMDVMNTILVDFMVEGQ